MTDSFNNFDLFNPTEEHKMLRQSVRQFVQAEVEPQAGEYNSKEVFNLNLFRKLGDLGLLGITVESEYGGSEMDAIAAVIAHEEISASDPAFCLSYLAHSMLCVNNMAVNASEEQKKKYLPGLCSGELIGCMAMSEPHVGTDVFGMKTRAQKEAGQYIINGEKMWITNGAIDDQQTPADLVWLYAKTGEKKTDVSTFIVEKKHKGYRVGQKIREKLGMRASNTAELVFEDCKIPQENLVGKENDSLHHMMKNLELERLTLAAMSLGIAKRSLQIMHKYAQERQSFGSPLTQFGQIQRFIGESYAEYQSARSFVYNVARQLNLRAKSSPIDSDAVKLVAAKVGKDISDRAIQVLGGYGYVGEYVVERLWRDAKLLEIGGGTMEAHQKNICTQLNKNSQVLFN